jgi:hypothetical protein
MTYERSFEVAQIIDRLKCRDGLRGIVSAVETQHLRVMMADLLVDRSRVALESDWLELERLALEDRRFTEAEANRIRGCYLQYRHPRIRVSLKQETRRS